MFADYLVRVVKTKINIHLWNTKLNSVNIKINMNKTKIIVIAKPDKFINIQINGHIIEQLQNLKYQGTIIDKEGYIKKDIIVEFNPQTNYTTH